MDLVPKDICIVVREYQKGQFHRRYHEHIPQHRISQENLGALLKALVLKFQNNEPLTIVRSFLNQRGKEPSAYTFMWHVMWPELGVVRRYCGTDVCAWADQVVQPSNFRTKKGRLQQPNARTKLGYSKKDLREVSDNPELTRVDFAKARPFSEVFPDLGAPIRKGQGPRKGSTKKVRSIG